MSSDFSFDFKSAQLFETPSPNSLPQTKAFSHLQKRGSIFLIFLYRYLESNINCVRFFYLFCYRYANSDVAGAL